jgi:hypothetical protein
MDKPKVLQTKKENSLISEEATYLMYSEVSCLIVTLTDTCHPRMQIQLGHIFGVSIPKDMGGRSRCQRLERQRFIPIGKGVLELVFSQKELDGDVQNERHQVGQERIVAMAGGRGRCHVSLTGIEWSTGIGTTISGICQLQRPSMLAISARQLASSAGVHLQEMS